MMVLLLLVFRIEFIGQVSDKSSINASFYLKNRSVAPHEWLTDGVERKKVG